MSYPDGGATRTGQKLTGANGGNAGARLDSKRKAPRNGNPEALIHALAVYGILSTLSPLLLSQCQSA
jgi:hypothetical protein